MCKKKHPTETLRRNTSPESARSKQRTALSYTLTNDQLTKITNQELHDQHQWNQGEETQGRHINQ